MIEGEEVKLKQRLKELSVQFILDSGPADQKTTVHGLLLRKESPCAVAFVSLFIRQRPALVGEHLAAAAGAVPGLIQAGAVLTGAHPHHLLEVAIK